MPPSSSFRGPIYAPKPAPESAAATPPQPTQDHRFLVEEAYNQEAGVVQHISAETIVCRALKGLRQSGVVLAVVFLAASPLMAQLPSVVSTTINYSATPNQLLTISGSNFSSTGQAPTVVFNGLYCVQQ